MSVHILYKGTHPKRLHDPAFFIVACGERVKKWSGVGQWVHFPNTEPRTLEKASCPLCINRIDKEREELNGRERW